ncbi:hypothetical protein CANARDRAFT_236088 [[Candida] arabinofermentans NRRL YB-2248]|uniref:Serine/threonine-protein phosphatase n=1 Tax=[Candida] arabinofermentans NRRL YB-2248 TaxID=983967 RepID=A0A1E4SXW5_9ASCO|nr:hypothetical protein CANARDRAFT_236088 [[Candida] arabinofermentans NRRL YB-2248]
MTSQQKLVAHENSLKIENALKQIKNRDVELDNAHETDLTIYIDDNGIKFKTTDRIIEDVIPPTSERPTDSKVFSNHGGLPNYKYLREHFKREGKLSEPQVLKILTMATQIFSLQPNLLTVPAPVTVCGDVHGQFFDLCKLFEICGDPDQTSFLFLGDYVDRGNNSLECLLLLCAMKINHPETFSMLRGNHETKQMTTHFTYRSECLLKHSSEVYKASLELFKSIPIAAIMNQQFFCVHGGISKELHTLSDLDKIDRFTVDFPTSGLYCDLMWADPSTDYDTEYTGHDNSIQSMFRPNHERGCSFMFTHKAVCKFLQRNNLLSVIRAHQAQDAGYRMYRKTDTQQFPSVITLFSAPNYCGTYGNKAAVLRYENSVMNIRQFSAQKEPYYLPKLLDVFTWSIPFVAERTADILFSVLNICTDEELEKDTPIARELVNSLRDVGHSLRNKILAIGRVSRMFNMLRQEAEKVEQLRSLAGGTNLPKGVLLNGTDALHNKISSFEEIRLADLANEGLPRKD